MNKNQIAINAVSTKQKNIEEALKAYSNVGFKRVEWRWPLVKEWLDTGKSLSDLKKLHDDHGVTCIGGFETTICAFGDEAAVKANTALHQRNAEILAALGGGTIVMGTDGPAGDVKPGVEHLAQIGQAVARLADKIDKSVTIAIEFNWSPVVKSIRSCKALVDAANHPRVGILFDPAHFHCTTSKFEDLTDEVCRQIKHVHVDDMRNKPGELSNCNSDRALPGQGVLDLKSIFGRIEKSGYKGSFSIEMFSDELWGMPVQDASKKMYDSMLTLVS